LKEAEAAFRAAVQANPKMVAAYNNLAVTMERRNRKKDAIALLERARKIDGTNADVNANLKRMRAG
jgi:Flp pilus assembly protein TadD